MLDESVASALPSFRLDGRLAIVTGASDGIGRAIAEAYAASGAELVLVSRRRVELEKVQRAIESNGGKAHAISADISDLHDVRALETDVSPVIAGRRLAIILVNCAGFGFTKAALDTTEEDWDNLLDLHAKGAFFARRCSRAK